MFAVRTRCLDNDASPRLQPGIISQRPYAGAPDAERCMSNPVITLTTDYGTSDHLVGVLKGVILRILPNASIVDINHHVVPFDVLDGALTIAAAYRYFPARTVHLVVVDPGVATPSRPIPLPPAHFSFLAPPNAIP